MKGFGAQLGITNIILKFWTLIFCLLIFILKFSKWSSEKFASQVDNLSLELKTVTFSQGLLKHLILCFSYCDWYRKSYINSITTFLNQCWEFCSAFQFHFSTLLSSLAHTEQSCNRALKFFFSDSLCHSLIKTERRMDKYLKAIFKIQEIAIVVWNHQTG